MSLYNINKQTQIDEFGVDHSNFSLRDEIEYNFRRAKEKEMQQNLRPTYWQQTPTAYQGRQSSLPVNAQSYLSSESQTKSELTDDQKIARQFVSSLPDMGAYNPPKAQGYYIKDDKNYAWTMPHKYDHRPDNFFAQVHNFMEMNKEHPVEKPVTTGYPFTDFMMKSALKKIHPLIAHAMNAYNLGYQGAGYYDNWQQAKEVGKYEE